MPPPKRASSPIGTPRKRSKKAATITEDDEEDSLESILAQIKAQEESETLAKQLHDEWNAPGPSSSRASRGPRAAPVARGHNDVAVDVIEISDDDDEPEDDEAMARRLAREWEADGVALIELSASTSQSEPRATRTQNNAESITSSDVPYISKLERYRDLFTGEKTCSCGANFASPRGHVVFSQQKSSQPSLLRLLHAPCKQCKTNHCRGCMTPVSCPLLCKGKDDHSDCPVETCCANVRIIAIFEALGGFDKIYLGERETSDQRAREAAAKARKHQVGSVGPGGTGYGMGDHGHFGLAYSHFKPRRGRTSGRGKATSVGTGEQSIRDALSSHFDEIVARALNAITGYLPAPYSDDPQIYDMLPHESIDALLFLSQLPDLLGNLLRNDSITDWIARIDVYHAMLALLRRMADCELTLEVLIGPRWEVSKSCGLEEWMWNDGNITWERDSDTDAPVSAPPLYAHFKKLTKQCETFLAGASSMLEHGVDEDGGEATETAVKATSLCGDIMAARDEIERAMTVMGKDPAAILHGPGLPSSTALSSGSGSGSGSASACTGNGKGKARDPGFDLERTYGRECERLAFQYATLSQPAENGSGLEYPGYNYAADVKRTANATRNPRDRLHLVKELAVMATSLPPGVWVRVDEIRNDAIKIMIAGPEGTPYAGGLFEFDCFIPLEYPNKPPLMHLRTTGGGSVRFNPNLYNSGKVCLSLLGTWPGRPEEQWSPKSTLLQVLVSIQSMILIELPYFNEPGYGKADPKNQRSIAYNKNICMQTTRWAIVDWLKDEHKDGVWAEVIASHFLTREVVIRKW
ncbi:hypothetical protein C8Q80DRAFT_26988 [Daedaleopsis nitida]|nr:hypothetical protein C8Q80DRAFT_26988 [Daedaleopsis nitida]